MSNSKPEQELVIACDFCAFTPEEREQHSRLAGELFAAVREVRELADGYSFRLPEDSAMLYKVADFIRHERVCCPFWTFNITVEAQGGAIWLQLTGPDGAKQTGMSEVVNLLNGEAAAGLR
jgi:hypothetical protein